jgi:hypothetical protein
MIALGVLWGLQFPIVQVRARLIVIRRISRKSSPQVRLTEDQHPVQALAAHGAYQPFRIAVCQGEPGEIGRSRIPMALNRDVKTCP